MTQPHHKTNIIGITLGDIAGIGPEIAIKAALSDACAPNSIPLLIGNASHIDTICHQLGYKCTIHTVTERAAIRPASNTVYVYHHTAIGDKILSLGQHHAEAGQEAMAYLHAAVDLLRTHTIDAVATCPVNKKSIHLAGHHTFHGHTEFFAQASQTDDYVMLFYADIMKLALVTRHIPLAAVSEALSTKEICRVIRRIATEAPLLGIQTPPRFAVCGLNPHAGETSRMGHEETTIIRPAIVHLQKEGHCVEGPFSSDTLFIASNREPYDFLVAMYHDQGLIPFKMLAFDRGVNVTLGLPFIRTSVDHGTAFDKAGTNSADPTSLIHAIRLAHTMTQRKHIHAH